MAVIIYGIDIPKKHYMNGYYISDDGKVFDVSRKTVVGKAVQIPSGIRFNGDEAVCPKCGADAEWKKYCEEYGQRLVSDDEG